MQSLLEPFEQGNTARISSNSTANSNMEEPKVRVHQAVVVYVLCIEYQRVSALEGLVSKFGYGSRDRIPSILV